MSQPAPVQSVDRALQILIALEVEGRGQALGVAQIAARLGVHKSTASRLAATLAAHGFLERGPGEAFRLGRRIARLGLLAAGGPDLVDAARPAMEALAERTGETVVLSVTVDGAAVDIAQVESRYLVGGKSWIGLRTPLHATSDGKALLAFGAATLPPGRLESMAPRTLTSRVRLARELAVVRRTGWARAVGECEEGLNGIAAPVFGQDGRCVAAVSVSGPAYRLDEDALPILAPRCVEAGAAISVSLGWSRDAS